MPISAHLESSVRSVRSHPDPSVLIAIHVGVLGLHWKFMEWQVFVLLIVTEAFVTWPDCNWSRDDWPISGPSTGPQLSAHFARQYFKLTNDPEMRKITCIYLARPCFSFSLHFDSNYHQVFVHCNLLRTHPSSYETQASLMWWRAGIRNHDDQ